ncbi:hypothetical protein BLNAU_17016 [Blattamonas nauphoetae]|uniref:Secreted protein n=1 Tax=Blattamonas nauphoetae TaxID=2049346 RepID=A0ABQ9XB27_9EUKA|nr:hypothetical protein BLNAU_17016 [Blattamonas nauphoetae]
MLIVTSQALRDTSLLAFFLAQSSHFISSVSVPFHIAHRHVTYKQRRTPLCMLSCMLCQSSHKSRKHLNLMIRK